MHFGEHMMIDGYGGSEAKLNDKQTVLDSINELTSLLGMKQLAKPEVYFAPDNHIKDPGGWSGFVVIAESHISVHTFPARGFLSADVYTCRNGMDRVTVREFFQSKFELKDIEENFVKRGMKYCVASVSMPV